MRLCPIPSSSYKLPLQPVPAPTPSPKHPHPPPSPLSCHVCKSASCGGWHSDGVKPDGSHKAGDVAQSNEGGTHTHTHTNSYTITHSHFLSLMNSHELFITHTRLRTHASRRAHTQLLSATEGSATSLYFIIISLGIFLGCKGIPGGARPLKLSTPPPTSLPFPPCPLSRVLRLSPCHPLSSCFSLSH